MKLPSSLALVLGVGALVLGIVWWATRPDPTDHDAELRRLDSLAVVERARAVVLDSVIAVQRARDDSVRVIQAARELRVAVLVREAATWERAAHRAADSARALGDTLSLAWSAYQASERRGDSLTVALVIADSARVTAELSARAWRVVADSAQIRVRELVTLTDELLALPRPRPRDWSVGVGGGMGCTVALSGAAGACGPTISVGISRRIF